MTEILDAIEFELVAAVRRRNARARRRRVAGIAIGGVAALAIAAGGGVATLVDSPLDTLFPNGARQAQPADSVRSAVEVADGAGGAWSVVSYRTRRAFVATVLLRRPRTPGPPPVAGVSGGLLALRRLTDGTLAAPVGDAYRRDGRVHAAVGGTVDAAVRGVRVVVDGRSRTATLAPTTVTVPVVVDPAGLAPSIDRSKLPPRVTVRTFGVALPPRPLGGTTTEAVTLELTLADGTVKRERAEICLRERCTREQAAGTGRAG